MCLTFIDNQRWRLVGVKKRHFFGKFEKNRKELRGNRLFLHFFEFSVKSCAGKAQKPGRFAGAASGLFHGGFDPVLFEMIQI